MLNAVALGSVGKTSLVLRYCKDEFNGNEREKLFEKKEKKKKKKGRKKGSKNEPCQH
jgi:GTPase SAR1 family protein